MIHKLEKEYTITKYVYQAAVELADSWYVDDTQKVIDKKQSIMEVINMMCSTATLSVMKVLDDINKYFGYKDINLHDYVKYFDKAIDKNGLFVSYHEFESAFSTSSNSGSYLGIATKMEQYNNYDTFNYSVEERRLKNLLGSKLYTSRVSTRNAEEFLENFINSLCFTKVIDVSSLLDKDIQSIFNLLVESSSSVSVIGYHQTAQDFVDGVLLHYKEMPVIDKDQCYNHYLSRDVSDYNIQLLNYVFTFK